MAAAALQVAVLLAGYYPFYRDGLREARRYFDGSPTSTSLKRALENQPLYRYFEQRPGIRDTRVYMAAGADRRLFRKAADYKFEGWPLHGLRMVNGLFKGVDMHELTPAIGSTSAARSGATRASPARRARWTRSASATCSQRRATVSRSRCAR